jgi:hypothetical protein
LVEQLIRNQQVVRSIRIAGSSFTPEKPKNLRRADFTVPSV